MKNKLLPIVIICTAVLTIVSATLLLTLKPPAIDTVRLNALLSEVEDNSGEYENISSDGLSFAVIDYDGAVLYKNISVNEDFESYDEWINFAYKNDCVIMDFSAGKILVFKPENGIQTALSATTFALGAGVVLTLIIYWLYLRKAILIPFKRLKDFAGDIAAGNLDGPLLMDKHNVFGAFTESFDIMREELKRSQEMAAELEKSKKELVAELSHDIKTPVASIKAVAEVLEIGEKDEKKKKHLLSIRRKAEDIDALITDMFTSTMQDLSELKINLTDLSSVDAEKMIKDADHLKKIAPFKLPDCLLVSDPIRLNQVFSNIINNSYKYAGTDILLSSKIEGNMLKIEFRDAGGGVQEDELPLITNKFFRGINGKNKSGAGLGLYICKTVLEKTGGALECFNTDDGFSVNVFIKLA